MMKKVMIIRENNGGVLVGNTKGKNTREVIKEIIRERGRGGRKRTESEKSK